MNRKQIVANVCVASSGVIFLAIMMWFLPERALDLLFICVVSVSLSTLILWRARVDQRKDERTMQLMTLGGRNAFMFLIFVMPFLAGFIYAGIILIDAVGALMLLWAIALGIAWISFLYYYTR
ncbi:MAG: hypothetical protein ACXABM_14590 [Candidatus Thorarchaeota archaeon]